MFDVGRSVCNMLKTHKMFWLAAKAAAFFIVVLLSVKWFIGDLNILRVIGLFTVTVIAWRCGVSFYRRVVLIPKKPLQYGKWAIITGCTAGIGKDFAEHLALTGMSVLLISRSEEKLVLQQKVMTEKFKVEVKYFAHDFTKSGSERKAFYDKLDDILSYLDRDGGIGILVNNVGITNEVPKTIEEFSEEEIENIIQCNIHSTVFMTRAVLKYMKNRKNGAIISISAAAGEAPSPYLSVFSATKAFVTQFSRSLKVEWWDSGVDFLVTTPYFIASNSVKKKEGGLITPLPITFVKGTLAQLGKKFIWQGHGHWAHGMLGLVGKYYWDSVRRHWCVMVENKRRYDERHQRKQEDNKKVE